MHEVEVDKIFVFLMTLAQTILGLPTHLEYSPVEFRFPPSPPGLINNILCEQYIAIYCIIFF
jgi:hypothetical protein